MLVATCPTLKTAIWPLTCHVKLKKGELSFGGGWAPKLTKGSYNSWNWVEGYEIVMDKYTL